MRRFVAAVTCALALGCAAARQRRAEEHLRNELSFFVPYVDLDAEERATRRVLSQRHLVVDETLQGDGYRALEAASIDHKKSAVRIITRRGVVAAEDGDVDDWFALKRVELAVVASRGTLPEALLGIVKTARGRDAGCMTLYRLSPDGRLVEVELRVQRFGSLACVNRVHAIDKTRFEASVVWPVLSAGVAPQLSVELKARTARLDAPDAPLVLSVAEDGSWLESAQASLEELPANARFAERQARAVSLAALASARGQSSAQQLGVYRSALGGARPGSSEAELMAASAAHIERGWSDEAPEPAPSDADATRIEPPTSDTTPPGPDDVVIEPDAR